MVEKVICFVSCFLCAVPFFIVSKYDKDSQTPIAFWSGDKSLKDKVKDVKGYNAHMAALYRKCAWAFVAAGVCGFVEPTLGVVLICLECTVGIYIVYRAYKKILKQFS